MKTKLKYLALLSLLSTPLYPDSKTTKETLRCGLPIEVIYTQLENWNKELQDHAEYERIISEYKCLTVFTVEEQKVMNDIADYFNIRVEWLYKLLFMESGFDPGALNDISGASGLIGFLPSTALKLGTTTEELRQMSRLQQLPWVKLYLQRQQPKTGYHSLTDLYLAVFFPQAIGKDCSYILGEEHSQERVEKVAKQNPNVDINKDNVITVAEFAAYANS